MIELENSEVGRVEIWPRPGSHWGVVCRDALLLVVTEHCNVEFDFNGTKYEVLVNDLYGEVKKVKETQDEREQTQP